MVIEHHTRHSNSWTKDTRYRGVKLYFVSKEGKLDWTTSMQTTSILAKLIALIINSISSYGN